MTIPPTRVATAASVWNTTATPKTASVSSLLTGDRVILLFAGADGSAGNVSFTPSTTVGTSSAWSVLLNTGTISNSVRIYVATATVTANSPTFTISLALSPSGVNWGVRLAAYRNSGGIGANFGTKDTLNGNTSTMDATFTATGNNSAIEIVAGDWTANATSPTTSDEREVQAGNEVTTVEFPGDGTTYGAFTGVYADAGAAGSKTVGWSLVRQPGIGAVEILGLAPPLTKDVPVTPGAGVGVDTREVTAALAGTVAKNATTTVTGSGSAFLSELRAGDVIRIPGGTSTETRIVSAIASDVSLTVTVAFTTTASGQTGLRVSQRQVFQWGPTSIATPSIVTAAAADTTLKALNQSRIGMTVYNDSSATLYLKYGTGASATSYTVRISGGGYWEMPVPIYTGAVNGNWVSADGSAYVTELTA
jgi:hypothetical protein